MSSAPEILGDSRSNCDLQHYSSKKFLNL